MRGKIVNLCIGFMNVLLGALIIIFTIKVPQDKTLMTVQENIVIEYVLLATYAVIICAAIINLVQSYHHRTDSTFNIGYIIGVFSISFLFIKYPIIGIFNLISGAIVLIKSLKENLIELNSTTAISISIVMIAAIAIIGLAAYNYDILGKSIKNKENKNELAYKSDYFKYITELDINEPYINVKKDGKYGYINPNGDCVIQFKYDYASPFVEISAYDKKFHIALVCEDGSTSVILKNGREVMSYRTESSDDNYEKKIEELKDIYLNKLNQKEPMIYEVENIIANKNKAEAYDEITQEYTFRYDYNDEYDVIVTQSNMGFGDKYEFAKKEDLDIRISLNTTYLDYDENYLYLFSDGTIPFYEPAKKNQGWFTGFGQKREIKGNAQILEIFDERILIKNCSTNEIYFADNEGEMLSEIYKDIYVCQDGRFIVKDESGYFKVIDNEYNHLFDKKYAVIDTRLVPEKLYLVLDTTSNIKFNDYGYAIMNWKLMNYDGEIILDGIEAVYDQILKLPDEKEIAEENYWIFENNLKDLKYEFVGDKFYSN